MAAQFSRRSGLPFVGLRISNIMEPDDYQRFPGFWDDPLLRKWNLWGYVDVRDVAHAIRRGLEADIEGAEVGIVAAADTVMTRDSADLMAEVYPEVPLRGRSRAGRPCSRSIGPASCSATSPSTAGRTTSRELRLRRAASRSLDRGGCARSASHEVEITGGFWGDRQKVNSEATIAHCHEWMERLGWVGNFRAADRRAATGRPPGCGLHRLRRVQVDGGCCLGGRSIGLGRRGRRFTDLTAVIAPVQEEDGYLNTVFGRPGQPDRYSDLEWGHELYCYGHMLQAAVARARTGRADEFVEVAKRVADHVCNIFGTGASSGSAAIRRSSSAWSSWHG